MTQTLHDLTRKSYRNSAHLDAVRRMNQHAASVAVARLWLYSMAALVCLVIGFVAGFNLGR